MGAFGELEDSNAGPTPPPERTRQVFWGITLVALVWLVVAHLAIRSLLRR